MKMKFFDRMKDSVSSAGVGVGQKVSYTADTVKLNNQIRNNDKEIEKLIYQVGLLCVKLHLDDTNSEYEELFAQIRNFQLLNETYKEEIKHLAEELENKEHMRQQEMKERQAQREQEYKEKEELRRQQIQKRKTEKEQQAEIIKQKEMERQKQIDETTKLCKNCNQRSESDSKFCTYCGMPFPAETSETFSEE